MYLGRPSKRQTTDFRHNAWTKSHVHRESEYKDILWPDISLACLPAETVKNHETWPNHERIASANDQSESREVTWKEFKPTLFVLYLEVLLFTWRNHRFQAARKSAECRFEIRDGPGHLRRPFKPPESNQVGRHLPSSTFSLWFSENIKKGICDVAHPRRILFLGNLEFDDTKFGRQFVFYE